MEFCNLLRYVSPVFRSRWSWILEIRAHLNRALPHFWLYNTVYLRWFISKQCLAKTGFDGDRKGRERKG